MSNNTINTYQGNGTINTFLIAFDYIKRAFVEVYLDEELQTLNRDYTFQTDNIILFNAAPPDKSTVTIKRNTVTKELINAYIDPAILLAKNLNRSFTQPLHSIEELEDSVELSEIKKDIAGNIDLEGNRIINSGEPINDSDLATKGYVDKQDEAIQDFVERVDGDLIRFSNNTNEVTSNLQTQIDGISVAGTKISAEAGNAITVKTDGLFAADLSGNITAINNNLTTLNNDSTAQWVKINDTFNNVNALTTRTTVVEGVAGGNTTDINRLETRVLSLENTPSGGGFNTIEFIQTSIASRVVTIEGWYKVSVIGGGGGGGNKTIYIAGQRIICGGGGGCGSIAIQMVYIVSGDTIAITIGGGGAGSSSGTGGTGGTSTFTKNATSGIGVNLSFSAGGGGGGTQYGQGGAGGGGSGQWSADDNYGLGGSGANGIFDFGSGGGGRGLSFGGTGGRYATSGTITSGGSGGAGAVILEYFNPSL